ncbi:hypothetical protein [Chitinophaga solisilvae]|uniref:Uncharacterized protein n=1 Tax=Chitinophaga solisilvae TaxID=1233460 RepID=A0A9Q5DDS2_9BACT|nr:hypothetical protein [Chitinophaga solisilvae]NSL89607.1 hypothetical protein [Chitinophaga solisilvae]
MKKFLTGMLALFMGASVAMAQAPAATPAKKEAKVAKTKIEQTSAPKAKAEAKPVVTAKGDTHLKKDGTPDKRFKTNKDAASEGPKKKDGTPDMRFKSNNKEAGKKKA